jgi:DNA repair protein RecO (recombination protein O)
MSEIIKTEAIVLSKINYSESSLIVSLFTKSNGLTTAIIKGGRRPKSKLASVVDVLNHIQIILYRKESREVQIISSADLISYHPNIKSKIELSSHAFAICELVKTLLVENESNELIFNGLVRILSLIENEAEPPEVLFGRFLIFFVKEIGYEINLETCVLCAVELKPDYKISYISPIGFICSRCSEEKQMNNSELFNYLYCLKNRKKVNSFSERIYKTGNQFLINYLKSHIESFKGLNSLTML